MVAHVCTVQIASTETLNGPKIELHKVQVLGEIGWATHGREMFHMLLRATNLKQQDKAQSGTPACSTSVMELPPSTVQSLDNQSIYTYIYFFLPRREVEAKCSGRKCMAPATGIGRPYPRLHLTALRRSRREQSHDEVRWPHRKIAGAKARCRHAPVAMAREVAP